jgi:arylsulfatase A-like enzyme
MSYGNLTVGKENHRSASRVEILFSAIWFGLMIGLAEVVYHLLRHVLLSKPFFMSRQFIWMAPLFYITLFTSIGLIYLFLAWRWPKVFTWRLSIIVYSFLGFFSLLIMLPWLNKFASAVLAIGLAVQTSRIAVKHPQLFFIPFNWGRMSFRRQRSADRKKGECGDELSTRIDRRQFLFGVGAVVAGLAVAERGAVKLNEWQGINSLPATASGSPNLLLIVMDTVRAQNTGMHGYGRQTTPFLDRLSKKGVQFGRAFATSNWTLPSHASMFTGRWHHELPVGWEAPLDDTYPTLGEVLYDHGYLTSGFVANTEYCSYDFGLDRGFVHYEDYSTSAAEVVNSASLGRLFVDNPTLRRKLNYFDILGRKNADRINQDFLGWLSRTNQRPFFSFINYYDAHDPYLPPYPYKNKFGPTERDVLLIDELMYSDEPVEIPGTFIQAELDAYDRAVAYIDQVIYSLMDELDRMGVLDYTLVIITSDHGEEFGEHGLYRHTNSLYLPTLSVPLTIIFPGRVPEEMAVSNEVSLRDLPATVLDLLGIEGESIFPGHTLSRFWNGAQVDSQIEGGYLLSEVNYAPNLPEWFPVSKGDMKSLINNGYHYILNGDLQEELYNFENDPWEQQNLAGTSEFSQLLEQFRGVLAGMLS